MSTLHNTEERFAVTAGLACLCGTGAAVATVPVVGYVLLGLVTLGVAGLTGVGVFLWWDTRFKPERTPVTVLAEPGAPVMRRVTVEPVQEVA